MKSSYQNVLKTPLSDPEPLPLFAVKHTAPPSFSGLQHTFSSPHVCREPGTCPTGPSFQQNLLVCFFWAPGTFGEHTFSMEMAGMQGTGNAAGRSPNHLLPQTLSKAGHMMKFNKEAEFKLLPQQALLGHMTKSWGVGSC